MSNFLSSQFWTPLFINDVFDESSYPENRHNKSYELTGIGDIEKYIGIYLVNDGDVIRFDNEGVISEVMGLPPTTVPFNGFLTGWTPGVLPGTPVLLIDGLNVDTSDPVDIAVDGLSVSITRPDENEYVQNVIWSDNVLDFSTGLKGIYFKLAAPSDTIITNPAPVNFSEGTYHIGFSEDFVWGVGTPPNNAVAVMEPINSTQYIVYQIGKMSSDNTYWETGDLDAAGDDIIITYSADLEFCIAIDETEGSYGSISLYASTSLEDLNTPAVPVAKHVFTTTSPAFTTLMAMLIKGGIGTQSFELIPEPQFPLSAVENISGGAFDTNSYPTSPAGQVYNVTGLTTNVVHPVKGLLSNGDLAFFNSLGELAGVCFGRGELIQGETALQQILAVIDLAKSSVGTEVWVPVASAGPGTVFSNNPNDLPASYLNKSFQIGTTIGDVYANVDGNVELLSPGSIVFFNSLGAVKAVFNPTIPNW